MGTAVTIDFVDKDGNYAERLDFPWDACFCGIFKRTRRTIA
ncbi:MAG: hypothetical protein ACLUKN_03145 [Bacilli bacterium]